MAKDGSLARRLGAVVALGMFLAVIKLSGRSAGQRSTGFSSKDFVALAQREMLVGTDMKASVRARMELLAQSASTHKDAEEQHMGVGQALAGNSTAPVAVNWGAGSGTSAPAANNGVMPAGWDKAYWSYSDWAFWILTGPIITIAFSFFMFYTYGVPAGVLTLLVCGVIDSATFYYNW